MKAGRCARARNLEAAGDAVVGRIAGSVLANVSLATSSLAATWRQGRVERVDVSISSLMPVVMRDAVASALGGRA